eukprot:Rmarinus@m.17135
MIGRSILRDRLLSGPYRFKSRSAKKSPSLSWSKREFRRTDWEDLSHAFRSKQSILNRVKTSVKDLKFVESRSFRVVEMNETLLDFLGEKSPISLVTTADQAHAAVQSLSKASSPHHACHVESSNIDIKKEHAMGKGRVACIAVYGGPGTPLYLVRDYEPVLSVFKQFLEDERLKKVWHHYGVQRHVLENVGIFTKGFQGDVLHMGRMLNTSLFTRENRAFEIDPVELYHIMDEHKMSSPVAKAKWDRLWCAAPTGIKYNDVLFSLNKTPKITTSKIPPIEILQGAASFSPLWMLHVARKTALTWSLYDIFRKELDAESWVIPWYNLAIPISVRRSVDDFDTGFRGSSMFVLYNDVMKLFGELLTDVESHGIRLDQDVLADAHHRATSDLALAQERFQQWSEDRLGCSDIQLSKRHHLQYLLYGETSKVNSVEDGNTGDSGEVQAELKCSADDGLEFPFTSLFLDPLPGHGLAVTSAALEDLEATLTDRRDQEALRGIRDIAAISKLLSTFIEPLRSLPSDGNGRMHSSININTQTGRLSSRFPNLQNIPALARDRYRVRDAFVPDVGNMFIVADYSQLELRVLGYTSRCNRLNQQIREGDLHSMMAFHLYDHVNEHITEILQKKWGADVDIENHPQEVASLVKQSFPEERKRAKHLNFGIVYGMSKFGIARDFKVDYHEAQALQDRWYKTFPEIDDWSVLHRRMVKSLHSVRTLLGRKRHFKFHKFYQLPLAVRGSIERQAVNTPIQGGAADIMMMAMLKIWRDEEIQRCGYRMVMQIHDELILEGPSGNAEAARDRIVQLMEYPFEGFPWEKWMHTEDAKKLPLPGVHFPVVAEIVSRWGNAK